MKRVLIIMLLAFITTSQLFAVPTEEPTRVVEQLPTFNGKNYGAFKKWLQDEVFSKYTMSKSGEVSGEVHLQFVIEKDGAISAVEILKSPDEALSKCVTKALNKTPKKLSPAIKDGAPVRFRAALNIIFTANVREAGYYPQGVLMAPNTTLTSSASVALGSNAGVKDGGESVLHDNHKTLLNVGDTTKLVFLKRGVSNRVQVKDLHSKTN